MKDAKGSDDQQAIYARPWWPHHQDRRQDPAPPAARRCYDILTDIRTKLNIEETE